MPNRSSFAPFWLGDDDGAPEVGVSKRRIIFKSSRNKIKQKNLIVFSLIIDIHQRPCDSHSFTRTQCHIYGRGSMCVCVIFINKSYDKKIFVLICNALFSLSLTLPSQSSLFISSTLENLALVTRAVLHSALAAIPNVMILHKTGQQTYCQSTQL